MRIINWIINLFKRNKKNKIDKFARFYEDLNGNIVDFITSYPIKGINEQSTK